MCNQWTNQIFDALQVRKGGVVRRDRYWVDRYSSLEEIVEEARARSFHVVEVGDQVIVYCNEGEMRIHC